MAGNSYGFDFLKTEHTLGGKDAPRPAGSTKSSIDDDHTLSTPIVSAESVAHKPDLEKQADILRFLKAHRSAGYLPPAVIYKGTGIDLAERDETVAKLLENNPKISIESVPDPENPSVMLATYAYRSKYNHVRNKATLLAQVNRSKYGVDLRDLEDCYDGVEDDYKALITAGDIIAINNTEDKTTVLFPRGETFLVELDGLVTIGKNCTNNEDPPYRPPSKPSDSNSGSNNHNTSSSSSNGKSKGGSGSGTSSSGTSSSKSTKAKNAAQLAKQHRNKHVVLINTDVDATKQLRRGEAVWVGGEWFRVSSAVRQGSLEDQPARAQAPLSVTSLRNLSKRNEVDGYIRPFKKDPPVIPLDRTLSQEGSLHLEKAAEARQRLQKLAAGKGSGNTTSQLLSSLAHASNPSTLANSFASTMASSHHSGGSRNKRPHASKAGGHPSMTADQARQLAAAAHEAASDPHLHLYAHARRHGCTKDVRTMYLQTRSLVPTQDADLHNLLVQHKLLEAGEPWRRPKLKKKANVDNDGKPKKRRYYERKNQRMTNTHLVDTEIGAVLADAAEKIKQGKAVGDGGM